MADFRLLLPDDRGIIATLDEQGDTARGKDTVDHGTRGSDDHANALCGVAVHASAGSKYRYPSNMDWVRGGPSSPTDNVEAERQFQEARFSNHVRVHGGYFHAPWRQRW